MERVIEALSEGIKCKTISNREFDKVEQEGFERLFQVLQFFYPKMFEKLQWQQIWHYTLLFLWPGSEESLEPGVILASQDVRPTETSASWKYPPFEGTISEGAVWGRGSFTPKGRLFAVCEAVEQLLEQEYTPKRSMYLVFGEDRESGGAGTGTIARMMRELGIHLAWVLDEGAPVLGGYPGLDQEASVIGITEKSAATLELSLEGRSGKSIHTPGRTLMGMAGEVLQTMERFPMPYELSDLVKEMLITAGQYMKTTRSLVVNNLNLTRQAVLRHMEREPYLKAMIQTSVEPVMVTAAPDSDQLPDQVKITALVRALPGHTGEEIQAYLKDTLDLKELEIRLVVPEEGFGVKTADQGEIFERVRLIIQRYDHDCPVIPGLYPGITDSRYFKDICSHIYRFSPFDGITLREIDLLPRENEHLGQDTLKRGVQIFTDLIREL